MVFTKRSYILKQTRSHRTSPLAASALSSFVFKVPISPFSNEDVVSNKTAIKDSNINLVLLFVKGEWLIASL